MAEREASEAHLLTPAVRAYIGYEAGPFTAPDLVEPGAIRRFRQATLDDEPDHWYEAARSGQANPAEVAPALFPLYAFRQSINARDPLLNSADPDFDGTKDNFFIRLGLPELPIPLKRFLNGGHRLQVYRLADVGDRLLAHSKYLDIQQKGSPEAPMIIARAEATFHTEKGDLLLQCEQTLIWR